MSRFLKIQDEESCEEGVDLNWRNQHAGAGLQPVRCEQWNVQVRRLVIPQNANSCLQGQLLIERCSQVEIPLVPPVANPGQVVVKDKGSGKGSVIKQLLFPGQSVTETQKSIHRLLAVFADG